MNNSSLPESEAYILRARVALLALRIGGKEDEGFCGPAIAEFENFEMGAGGG